MATYWDREDGRAWAAADTRRSRFVVVNTNRIPEKGCWTRRSAVPLVNGDHRCRVGGSEHVLNHVSERKPAGGLLERATNTASSLRLVSTVPSTTDGCPTNGR